MPVRAELSSQLEEAADRRAVEDDCEEYKDAVDEEGVPWDVSAWQLKGVGVL